MRYGFGFVMIALSGLAAAPARGDNPELARASLIGIGGVHVQVGTEDLAGAPADLSAARLQAAVEARLRHGLVRTLTDDEAPGEPVLHLRVSRLYSFADNPIDVFDIRLELGLYQAVLFPPDTTLTLGEVMDEHEIVVKPIATWSIGADVRRCFPREVMPSTLRAAELLAEHFVKDYRLANPQPGRRTRAPN